MVDIPLITHPLDQYRVVPIGTEDVDAGKGGQILVAEGGSVVGTSRRKSIYRATSALPRFTTSPDNRPYPSVMYPLGTGYPAGNYHNWGMGLIMGGLFPNGSSDVEVTRIKLDGNQPIPQFPYGNAGEIALTEEQGSGIWMTGGSCAVRDCTVWNFRGSGIRSNNWDTGHAGSGKIPMSQIFGNDVSMCWTGICVDYPDTMISDNMVCDNRTFGTVDMIGSSQYSNNHFYGAQTAMQWGVVFNIGIGSSKSINDTVADAPVGFLNLSSARGSTWAMYSQHCWFANFWLIAQTAVYDPVVRVSRSSTIKPNIIGIKCEGSGQSIRGGYIELNDFEFSGETHSDTTPYPGANHIGCTGISLEHSDHTISDMDIFCNNVSGQTRQYGIFFKYIADATKQQHNIVENVRLHKFNFTGQYGVFVEESSAGSGVTALRGGGHRIKIYGSSEQGTLGSPNDHRLRLPTGWSTGTNGTNRVWLNDEEILPGTYPVYPPP